MKKIFLLTLAAAFIYTGCGDKEEAPPEKTDPYVKEIKDFRAEKDDYMKNDPNSPFNKDPKAEFHPLKYYPVDKSFVFESRLHRFENPEEITILGTKGEERTVTKFGYVEINYKGKRHKLNVYQGTARTGDNYYSIWFTDKTTGEETYGVGRYIDFEIEPDTNYVYKIDFNLAYSPYCSYSSIYSCAVPTKDDHLDIAVKAGEKKFHD